MMKLLSSLFFLERISEATRDLESFRNGRGRARRWDIAASHGGREPGARRGRQNTHNEAAAADDDDEEA